MMKRMRNLKPKALFVNCCSFGLRSTSFKFFILIKKIGHRRVAYTRKSLLLQLIIKDVKVVNLLFLLSSNRRVSNKILV